MKFAGKVGFWVDDVEVKPGIHRSEMIERPYVGDVTRSYHKWEAQTMSTDDNLRLNNQITILADLYARQNWGSIKYVVWSGVRWKVNTIQVSFPRLTLEIGGVWNGETPEETDFPSLS